MDLMRFLSTRKAPPADTGAPTKMIVGLGNPGPEYARNRHNIGFQVVELFAGHHGLTLDKFQKRARIAIGPVTLASGGLAYGEKGGLAYGEKGSPAYGEKGSPAYGEKGSPAYGEKGSPAHGEKGSPAHGEKGWRGKVLLVKPMTYMNASGEAVGALAAFYKIAPADILVVSDDLDLPPGKLRLRAGGSAGGQKGVKSIIQHLHSDSFPRLRIGIGRPGGAGVGPPGMDPADYVLQNFTAAEEAEMAFVRPRSVEAIETWLAQGIEAAMNQFNPDERRKTRDE